MKTSILHDTSRFIGFFLKTKAEFQDKYQELIRKKNSTIYNVNKYAPYGYDGIFMLANALNATEEKLKRMNQSLREFTFSRLDITEIIKEKISETDDIEGLTVGEKT